MNHNAEVICVGSELLLGQILNTNAQFLATELAQLGIPHYLQTVVGDNEARIHQVLAQATQRTGVLIFTGGLGPTADDLTHESLASFFGVPMTEQPGLWEDLVAKLTVRGRPPTPTQRKQCAIPQGATVLPNPWGTAVGILWEAQPGLHILTFPGVPREMHAMWRETAVPYLQGLGWGAQVFASETLRFWGISEAALAEKVAPLLQGGNPTVAPYAKQGEVHLRVTAAAPNVAMAQALMDPVIREIQQIAGADYFGKNETTLAAVVGELLTSHGQTLALAETCTGGLVGQLITSVPGSSRYFLGGVLAYDNRIKATFLGVDPHLLNEVGAVSPEVALQMAQGVRDQFHSDWGLALTGISGPGGGTAAKPVGLVYMALVGPKGGITQERRFWPNHGREFIRWLTAHSALDWLRRQW